MSSSNDYIEEGANGARHAQHSAGSGAERKPRFAQPGSQPRYARPSDDYVAPKGETRKPRFKQDASQQVPHLHELPSDQPIAPSAPVGEAPYDDSAFSHIQAADGAVLTTRHNASEAASAATKRLKGDAGVARVAAKREQASKRRLPKAVAIAVGVIALAVIVGVFVMVRGLITAAPTQDEAVSGEQAQVSASLDEEVTYNGREFSIVEGEDGWQLVSSLEGGAQSSIEVQFEGAPVALIRYNEAFLIPENLPDGTWDVCAYISADGSVAIRLTDGDGNPYVGEGQLASASLDGDSLVLVGSDGSTTAIPLS